MSVNKPDLAQNQRRAKARRFAIAAIVKKPHFMPMIHLDGKGAVFF
jgi:hypothetical protein